VILPLAVCADIFLGNLSRTLLVNLVNPKFMAPTSSSNPDGETTFSFLQALSFAAYQHRHQRRKDNETPYINHPIAVASILRNEAGVTDESVLVAALLHDTVEDTETTFAEIEQLFGSVICGIVSEVTDDKSLPKAIRKQKQVEHAAGLSKRAKLLKLADKTANLRDMVSAPPVGWPRDRINDYLDWGKAVVDELRGVDPQLEALFDRAYEQGKSTVGKL